MNRSELTAAVAARIGRTNAEVAHVVDALSVVICETVASGEEVAWTGMFKVAPSRRAAAQRRNPTTQKTIDVPAKTVPKFTPYKDLKDAAARG